MLRKAVYKRNAITAVLLILAMLWILTVYPLRLYKRDIVFKGPEEITEISDYITRNYDVGTVFTASYAHLESITIYIEEMKGHDFQCRLFGTKEDGTVYLAAEEFVNPDKSRLPGYVTVTLDVDLEPGKDYTYIFYSEHGWARAGLSQLEQLRSREGTDAPLVRYAFYHDTTEEGKCLTGDYIYRMPISREKSLGFMAAIALAAAVLAAGVQIYFRRNPDRDTPVTIERILQRTLTPLIFLLGAAGLTAVIPFRVFDKRLPDILFYSTGILLAMGIGLYILWHDRTEMPGAPGAKRRRDAWRHTAISFVFAAALQFGCNYMNDLYDIFHLISERKVMLALLLLLLLTFRAEDIFTRTGLLWTAGYGIFGTAYYILHRLGEDTKEYSEKNFILAALLWIVFLAGLLIPATVRKFTACRHRISVQRWFAAVIMLLFAVMIIGRNGRKWMLVLPLFYTLFYLRFVTWEGKDRWLQDIAAGVGIQFFFMVGYCLLHRVYLAFIYTRYPMNFHTVTVTAVYLTVVQCAAATLFLEKLLETEGQSWKRRLASGWPQILFFGVASSYMVMTMSRTGAMAVIAVLLVLLTAYGFSGKENAFFGEVFRKGFRRAGLWLLLMILVFAVHFPAVFTLQRIVPAVISEPRTFELESYPQEVTRGNRYDSMYYMCLERFWAVFGNKYFGLEEKPYDFYHHWDNVEEDPEDEEDGTAGGEDEDGGEEQPEEKDQDDYSNGRMDIFRAYLRNMNLTGHKTMGAPLEDGTIAVHAHDIYLQLAYDSGVPAGILFLLILALTWFRACIYYKRRHPAGEAAAALPLAAITGFGVTGIVEWVFHLCNPMTILLMMCIAPLLLEDAGKTEKTRGKEKEF